MNNDKISRTQRIRSQPQTLYLKPQIEKIRLILSESVLGTPCKTPPIGGAGPCGTEQAPGFDFTST